VPDEAGGPGVGSVAEETARLLDALLAPPPAQDPVDAAYRSSAETTPRSCPTCGQAAQGSPSRASTADVCHLCPVCQVLRVLRSVRPETLDRLADLAAAVTETLRDAASSRSHHDRPGAAADDGQPPGTSGSRVEDIPVVGEDDPVTPAPDGRDEGEETR
jgi:hypothetical protein